jgi:two-component system, cell cycle sensor histidine kinase and response regulator CckA
MRPDEKGTPGVFAPPAPGEAGATLEELRAVFAGALDAILLGRGAVITDVNPAACALIGLPREAIVGRTFLEFHPPESREDLARRFATMMTEGRAQGEADVVHADGSVRRVEFSATANIVPDVHLSILRDVTARRAREVASERYALLSRHARDIVLFIDPGGVIVEANDAASAAYGYAREELLGMNIRDLRAEETRMTVAAQMEEAFSAGVLFETVHRRRDGSTFPVEIGSRAALVGRERMLLSIGRDLTERAEMQANLLHADRLAAVGTLAAGVAHEVNNPLAYAMGNLDMMARRLPEAVARLRAEASRAPEGAAAARLSALAADLAETCEMLTVAREGAARVRTIVLDLKRFSRPDEALVGPVDVHEVLEYAIGIAASELRHRARLVREYGAEPLVAVNESRLGQVFLNLLLNAAQAIPEGDSERHEIRVRSRVDGKGSVVVEVADTGVGIPPRLLGRVFDPFVTTKPSGEGTGLGLFVCRSIVKDAGGEIAVESEVGRGTTVRVTLPAVAGR